MNSDDEDFELPFSDLGSIHSTPSRQSASADTETPDSMVQLRSPAMSIPSNFTITTPTSERTLTTTPSTGSTIGSFESGNRRLMAEDFEDIDFVDVNETFPTPEEIIPALEMISNSLDDDDGRLTLVNRLIRNYRQNRLTRADLEALRRFAPIIFRIRENDFASNKRSRRN